MPKQKAFSAQQEEDIKKRDDYRCVICGAPVEYIDTIMPPDALQNKANILRNGIAVCEKHYHHQEGFHYQDMGKSMFLELCEIAEAQHDKKTLRFCEDVLKTYEAHDINGHIEWEK